MYFCATEKLCFFFYFILFLFFFFLLPAIKTFKDSKTEQEFTTGILILVGLGGRRALNTRTHKGTQMASPNNATTLVQAVTINNIMFLVIQ